MRFEGVLLKWDDERGFGFIQADQGGAQVFVHISACPKGQGRPQVGERVSFEVHTDTARQRKQATRVQFLDRARQQPASAGSAPAQRPPGRAGGQQARRHHRPGRTPGGRLVPALLTLALLGAGVWAYDRFQQRQHRQALASQPVPALLAQPQAPAAAAPRFQCDGRTHCSQMRSCAEATYFLNNCPGTKMDGDGDGIPCEEQLCRPGL